MYARFTETTTDSSKRKQLEEIAIESIIPAARQQKGFKGVLFATNSEGRGVFVSFWESKEALQATESSGYYNEQLAKIRDAVTAPTVRHTGEVAALEVASKTAKAARLTVSSPRAEVLDQERQTAGELAKRASREPGFCAWFGIVSEDGKAIALSAWESGDALERSAKTYMAEALSKLKERVTEPPRQTVLDVLAAELPAAVGIPR